MKNKEIPFWKALLILSLTVSTIIVVSVYIFVKFLEIKYKIYPDIPLTPINTFTIWVLVLILSLVVIPVLIERSSWRKMQGA